MTNNINLIVYPVSDLEQAQAHYTKFLGVEPYTSSPYYVGYKLGNLEVGLDPNGQAVISYIDVTDIKSSLQDLTAAGWAIAQDAKNVGGGLMTAQVKDTNGNVVGLRQS